ncbi:MarP family serine protease [Microbacterium kribbense]|uniref:MarP family serine protease n=1 Tax=Microbacterium kribbense TaxID=433645 RepID=A0ABP7GBN3_9MICO
MAVVDVVLVVVLAVALLAGLARGVIATIGVFAGLAAGGAAALWAAPAVGRIIAVPIWGAVAETAAWAVLLAVGATIGGAVGVWVRRPVDKVSPLRVVDRLLGGAVGVVVTALVVSLAATGIVAAGFPVVSAAVASSATVRTIDGLIPTPVQRALAQVRGTLAADGLPALGVILRPGTVAPAAPVSLEDPQVVAASGSVARVTGVAYACGVSQTGSSFAVAADTVVTNAHVVAGVTAPVVQLPGGGAHPGRIVYFDPAQDLAVISVPGLHARPLRLSTALSAGAAAVVAGYPYGGPLTLDDAQVLSAGVADVADIYGRSRAPRPVYALRAAVRPGNSGGPLLTAQGTVAGVVFARAEDDTDRGYAIAGSDLKPIVARLGSLTAPVSSGRCTG